MGNTKSHTVSIWPLGSLSRRWPRIREGRTVQGYGECWKGLVRCQCPGSTHRPYNHFSLPRDSAVGAHGQLWLLTWLFLKDSRETKVAARATNQFTKYFKGCKLISVCYNSNTTMQTVCHRNISCCQFLLLKLQLLAIEQINKDIFSFHSNFY